jgi:hypothetical protein
MTVILLVLLQLVVVQMVYCLEVQQVEVEEVVMVYETFLCCQPLKLTWVEVVEIGQKHFLHYYHL